ncbi:MAG: hypothetical protein WA323_16445 [Candidatus Nitrosopolaris sp.]
MAERNRFYCIGCSKFIEGEVVRYDSNDYPFVHHNNRDTHHVIFEADIQLLLDHNNSTLGESARYELAEMYGVSVQKLDQVLENVGGDL